MGLTLMNLVRLNALTALSLSMPYTGTWLRAYIFFIILEWGW